MNILEELASRARTPRFNARNTARDMMGGLATESAGMLDKAKGYREDAYGAYAGFDPNDYLSPEALQAVFDQAGVGFKGELGGMRATNARRGIRGPLAGALEGDLTSSFQRNLMGTAASFGAQRGQMALQRAEGMAGRADAETELGFATRGQGLELLMGERELETAEKIARQQERAAKRRGLGAGLGALAGGAIGFATGGWGGAAAGANIGGSAGAGFFG